MISIQNVSKRYGNAQVLNGVTADIPAGKITALIGANGAGKSTLLAIISRLLKGEGKVLLEGKDIDAYKDNELACRMATLRQNVQVMARLTVRELVSFGRYPYSKSRLSDRDREIVQDAIEHMALNHLADAFVDRLSGGERQRAFIAMVIAQDTPTILLDEPLNNLDMHHGVQIMRLVKKLCQEKGKTVVLVIHDIHFALAYADYIVALKDGVLVAAGDAQEVVTEALLHKLYGMPFAIREVEGQRICLFDP